MQSPLLALAVFVCWTLVLVLSIGIWRSVLVLRGKETPGVPDDGELYWRLNRAHLNAVENVGPFAALVLVAHAAGVTDELVTTCAWIVTGARFFQTAAHLSSGRSISVNVRFAFFLAQLIAMLVIGGQLIVTLASGAAGT